MKYILANWKMHLTVAQALLLFNRLDQKIKDNQNVEIILFPPISALFTLKNHAETLKNPKKFKFGVQNIYFRDEGAYTGEISVPMVKDLAAYAIVGHSERRIYFGETDNLVAKKLQASFRHSITPVLCVGENAIDHTEGHAQKIITDQLTEDLMLLTSSEVAKLIIAYEPIWAIGTGNFADPKEAEKMIAKIREVCGDLYGKDGEKVKVLYGGSVEPDNAKAYLKLKGCDGLLVGGASLNYQMFASIVDSAVQTV